MDNQQRSNTNMATAWALSLVLSIGATSCISTRQATSHQGVQAEAQLYTSQWHLSEDRIWVGQDLWTTDLSAWHIQNKILHGSVTTSNLQSLTLLTRHITGAPQPLAMRIQLTFPNDQQTTGLSGFQLGLPPPEPLIPENTSPSYPGLFAGAAPSGELVLLHTPTRLDLTNSLSQLTETGDASSTLELFLTARPVGPTYTILLQAFDPDSGKELSRKTLWNVPASSLSGHVGLGTASAENDSIFTTAFHAWKVEGSTATTLPEGESINGPFMGAWHTLHQGTLRMTAQLMPVSPKQAIVQLQTFEDAAWRTYAQAEIRDTDFSATFQVDNWNMKKEQPYRLLYREPQTDGAFIDHYWSGSIHANTTTQLTVRELPANTRPITQKLPEDILIIYDAPTPPAEERSLPALQTWYQWCLTFRDIGRDRSCLGIYHQSMTHNRVRIEISKPSSTRRTNSKVNMNSWKSADMKLICRPDMYNRVADLTGDSDEPQEPSTNAVSKSVSQRIGQIHIAPEERYITYNLDDDLQPSKKADPDWPIICEHSADYDRGHVGYLPPLEITGIANAVIQVTDEESNTRIYELRMDGSVLLPRVFATGQYTLSVGDPDTGTLHEFHHLSPRPLGNVDPIRVAF